MSDGLGPEGRVVHVCVSERKGQQKQPVDSARLVRGFGLEDDAHAGNWHRQVSLLEEEQIEAMRHRGLELAPGAFAENIATSGFDLGALEIGRRFRIGEGGVLQVTQRGKECHDRCAIYEQAGDCIMPRVGVFARVLRGGLVAPGAAVALDPDLDQLRYAVITASDRSAAGQREDASGAVIRELLDRALRGSQVAARVLPDDRGKLERALRRLCDEEVCDLVLTTGGTGLSPRDVTPDATAAVIDREIPGMAEAMRAAGLAHTPHAMLSRGLCGQRGSTIIINLSGSPRAVREQLEVLLPALPHALQVASGIPQDCGRQ
jgi:molybdenum cofactor synthesis domain-containing protein